MRNISSSVWWDQSWNPIRGCTPISEGCQNCYSKTFSDRFGHYWGPPKLFPEKLDIPFTWRKPRRVFVCSVCDLFHEGVKDEWIMQVFNHMPTDILQPCKHTYMVLTKRPARMKVFFAKHTSAGGPVAWPNVWLGVTAENQARADERIKFLLQTPAAKRFVSVEPMLGPVDLRCVGAASVAGGRWGVDTLHRGSAHLDWVIAGPETGPNKRTCDPAWIADLHQQCQAAGVPFWDKSKEPLARELPGKEDT